MNEEELELRDEFGLMNQSADWWKERANKVIGKLELLEKKFEDGTANEEDEILFESLLEETKTLIARGELENEALSNLEKKTKTFLMKKYEDPNDTRQA